MPAPANAQQTLKPSTLFCHDNLPVLRGINSASIDLIYLDPPFNKHRQISGSPLRADDPETGKKKGERYSFKDAWTMDDVKEEWHCELIDGGHHELYSFLNAVTQSGDKSDLVYLIYMAMRLMECRRILKPTGCIYYHCDPTMGHYVKLMMDCIFGRGNLVNEIVWFYDDTPGRSKRYFPRKHDIILFYCRERGGVHL